MELLSLKGKKIQYCIGCLACLKTGKCVQKDDAPEIMEKLRRADVLFFATPIYYYEMCGQMKTLLDRMNPLYSSDYAFREVYMIATAADGGDATFEKAYNGLQGWVDCFPKAKLCGLVAGAKIGDPSRSFGWRQCAPFSWESPSIVILSEQKIVPESNEYIQQETNHNKLL